MSEGMKRLMAMAAKQTPKRVHLRDAVRYAQYVERHEEAMTALWASSDYSQPQEAIEDHLAVVHSYTIHFLKTELGLDRRYLLALEKGLHLLFEKRRHGLESVDDPVALEAIRHSDLIISD